MNKIKISTKELMEYGLPWDGYDGVEVIEDNVVDNSRWSIDHVLIFKWIDGKTYRTTYSVGATEIQDEAPWEYEKEVDCIEVHKVPRLIEVWEAV